MTNNQAEYYGLLAGLEAAKRVGVKQLEILGDSQLVIRQVRAGGFQKLSPCKLEHHELQRIGHAFGFCLTVHSKSGLHSAGEWPVQGQQQCSSRLAF